MKILPAFFFLSLLLTATPTASAQEYDALIREANMAYESGDYARSGQLYEQAFTRAEPKGDHLYLATRSFVKANEPDKAFKYLMPLLDTGTALFNFLETDEHLRPLHTDPRWREFLAGMDRKRAEKYGPRFNAELRAELLRMGNEDQRVRDAWYAYTDKNLPVPDTVLDEISRVDSVNTARLQQIVAEHGWPEFGMVGPGGGNAAFLIAQHAPDDVLKALLPLAAAAAEKGEAEKTDIAMMTDRVLLHDGKPQIYGTQVEIDADGTLTLWPIEDEANVDTRRAELGMEPLAKYLKRFGIQYAPPSTTER